MREIVTVCWQSLTEFPSQVAAQISWPGGIVDTKLRASSGAFMQLLDEPSSLHGPSRPGGCAESCQHINSPWQIRELAGTMEVSDGAGSQAK